MPISLNYDSVKEILYCTCEGTMTIGEIESILTTIVSSDEYPPNVNALWNIQKVNFDVVDRLFEKEMILIQKEYPERKDAKLAIIVSDDHGFAMARMYEMMSEKLPVNIHVFRSIPEGEKWLQSEE